MEQQRVGFDMFSTCTAGVLLLAQLYPYHLADYVARTLRITPFRCAAGVVQQALVSVPHTSHLFTDCTSHVTPLY